MSLNRIGYFDKKPIAKGRLEPKIALLVEQNKKIISLRENKKTQFEQGERQIEILKRCVSNPEFPSFIKCLSAILIQLKNASLQSEVRFILKQFPEAVLEYDLTLLREENQDKISILLSKYRYKYKLPSDQQAACSEAINLLIEMRTILERESLTKLQCVCCIFELMLEFSYHMTLMCFSILQSIIHYLVQSVEFLRAVYSSKISQAFCAIKEYNVSLFKQSKTLEERAVMYYQQSRHFA